MLPPPAIVDEAPADRPEFDFAVGLSFWAPTERPVLGAFIAFVSWSGIDGVLHVRFYEVGQLTVYAGVEGFYSRALLLEVVGEALLGAVPGGGTWDFTPVHYGAMGRLGASFFPTSRTQPSLFFLAGTDRMNLGMSYTAEDGSYGEARYGETAVRLGGGVGVDFRVGSAALIGVEYRYQAARSFVTDSAVTLQNAQGDPLVDFEQQKWQSPPRGSAWAVRFGRRF